MIYRNTKTGALIEVSSRIKGADWEEVRPKEPAPIKKAPAQKRKGKKK